MGQDDFSGAEDSFEWMGIFQDVVSPCSISNVTDEYLAPEQVIVTDKFCQFAFLGVYCFF